MRTAVKFMIMNTIIIFSILSSSACTKTGGMPLPASSAAPTETPVPLPSKTAEPTATPTKTATPTEAPTPTETEIPLLEVKTTWNEGETAEDFPKCALEDIESGLYAKSVWRAVEKMPGFQLENIAKFMMVRRFKEQYNFKVLSSSAIETPKYDNPEMWPSRGVAVCVTEIEGKSVVVVTFQRLNPFTVFRAYSGYNDRKDFEFDGSSGLVNIGLENDEDTVTLEWLRKAYVNYIEHQYVYEITNKVPFYIWDSNKGFGNDFTRERALEGYIEDHREEITVSMEKFMDNGKLDFEKYIFSFLLLGQRRFK